MSNQFQKATKKKAKLRCALFGPSGSGKTFTALRIANGFVKAKLGKKIALIDSEHGSASKYSDRFKFDVVDLEKKSILSYINYIKMAEQSGYDILIIDSMTHAWKELLEDIDRIAKTKFRGNSFAAWSEGTPKHNAFVEALVGFKGHIISTMRSKTEWSIADEKGKLKPTRVGMAPEQGKGIEYEFDLLMEMSVDHIGQVIKDRTGKFQDDIIELPGEDFGQELAAWLNEGESDPKYHIQTDIEIQIKDDVINYCGLIKWDWNKFVAETGINQKLDTMNKKQLDKIKKDMAKRVKEYETALAEKKGAATDQPAEAEPVPAAEPPAEATETAQPEKTAEDIVPSSADFDKPIDTEKPDFSGPLAEVDDPFENKDKNEQPPKEESQGELSLGDQK